MYHFRRKIFVFTIICGLTVAQNDDPKYHGDPDSLMFPDPIDYSNGKSRPGVQPTERSGSGSSELSKSLQLAKEISSMSSFEEFLSLVHGVPETETFSLSGRIGDTGERSAAERPAPAACIPELQTVPLKQEHDPSTIYFPSCTRVKRCGGCCSHSLLTCQPIATETRNFEVLVTSIEQSYGLTYKGKRIVPLEEHTKCECDCKIKEEHCNEKQSYIPAECACKCNNIDEEEKCYRNSNKIWNPELCVCFCREEQECSTGFYFDQNTCRCRQVPLSKAWFPPTKGADYGFSQTQKPDNVPPVIIALDATDPRRKPKQDPEYK